jgi:nitroreductase
MKATGAPVLDAMLTRRSVQPLTDPGPTDDAAPTLIALVAAIDPKTKVPEWEQAASAACAGYAITLAAHALDLGAIWKSTPFTDGSRLREILGMSDGHRFFGWVNLGQRAHTSSVARPELATLSDVVHVLQSDDTQVPLGFGG